MICWHHIRHQVVSSSRKLIIQAWYGRTQIKQCCAFLFFLSFKYFYLNLPPPISLKGSRRYFFYFYMPKLYYYLISKIISEVRSIIIIHFINRGGQGSERLSKSINPSHLAYISSWRKIRTKDFFLLLFKSIWSSTYLSFSISSFSILNFFEFSIL